MTTRVPAQMRGLSPIAGNNALQINAAIDALAAAGGGTVELTAGDFPTTTSIVMKAGVDLVGQGMLATQIQ
jgi:polygalacturonase